MNTWAALEKLFKEKKEKLSESFRYLGTIDTNNIRCFVYQNKKSAKTIYISAGGECYKYQGSQYMNISEEDCIKYVNS